MTIYIDRRNRWKRLHPPPPKNVSPFVKSLYETYNAMNGPDYSIDYTSPKAVLQVYNKNQQIKEDASRTAAKQNEWNRQNQPMVDNGTVGVMKTQGQFEKEVDDKAKSLVGNNFDSNIDNAINAAIKNAHAQGIAGIQNDMFPKGTLGADAWISDRKYNQANDPEKILADLTNNLKAGVDNMLSNPKTKQRILNEAKTLGIDPESYIRNSIAPAIIERASERFDKTELSRMMPRNSLDYIVGGISDSMIGTLLGDLRTTRGQREYQQRAMQATRGGQNPNFKPSMWDEAGRGAVSFLTDAPVFGAAGKTAGFVTNKAFGSAARQAIVAANQSAFARVGTGIAKGTLHGGVTGFQYGFMNGAVQNFSTGEDTSFGATLKSAVLGGASEMASFAAMEGMGGVVGAIGHKIGFNGTEKGFWQGAKAAGKKITFEALKTGFEGLGMATGGVASGKVRSMLTGEDSEGFTTEGTLESCASAVIFKLMHVKDAFGREYGRGGKKLNFKNSVIQKTARFLASDALKSSPSVFSNEEKAQLLGAGGNLGMTPVKNIIDLAKRSKGYKPEEVEKGEDGSDVLSYYQQIMQDPNVSWDAKAKFTTLVMGTMPESRPMMDHFTFSKEKIGGNEAGYRRYVNEYSKDGELLSKQEYDTIDKRDRIVYLRKMVRENQRLFNSLGILATIDKSDYNLQNEFFKLKAKDKKEVEGILNGMHTQGSEIDKEYTQYVFENGRAMKMLESVATRFGISKDALLKAVFYKNAMKRTDNEQRAVSQLRKECESIVCPENKVHTEQSNMEGKDIAEENNLGSESPNQEAVTKALGDLANAEDGLQEMMDSNDVFKETYDGLAKQGLTNPQIYDAMIQQNGLTEEQLEPFARYINANARVQGMQEATQEAIEQHVESVAGDWAFHGTMDGNKTDGTQMLYVRDSNGRTLLVGTGEVSYDPTTGKPKEGVGDMLVCLDTQTRQTVYVKVEDTTLDQMQDVESFKNEERLRLQNINAAPYNQAAQEQAAKNAAKPQQEGAAEPENKVEQPQQENAEIPQQNYTLSDKKTAKGDTFYQDENGNINLAEIPDEVFDSIGYTKAPFRLTESMVKHILNRHKNELGISTPNEAIHFVRDVMANFDHVRLGNDGALVFSIENGRKRTGKRAITIFINEEGGDFYGLKTSGFENIKGLERRPLLWERGVKNESSATDTATANVATNESQLSGEQSGNASNQSIGLGGKDTNNSSNGNGVNTTLTLKDGSAVPVDANGEPDFMNMTPEQGAEVYKTLFPKTYEAEVDSAIKMLDKDLKKVQKATPKSKGVMARAKEQAGIEAAINLAEEQLAKAQAIKKALTAEKVAETMAKPEGEKPTEGANQAGSVAAEKFQNAPRLVGNKRTRTLSNNEKVKGHYEIVPAESLTPSHDAMNGYKKTDGFPVDSEGRTINDRDYENDKSAQQNTDQIALKYNGQAIEQVPVVSDEGIVYDGNGRTMAGQKAAKDGTDAEYINDLMDNAENFGFTREQIEQSGIEHPRLVMVTDERLPYTTDTFAKFNRNEKKTQSNTEQAVAKAKTLSADEVGAIVAEIEGNGSLDAFFNNPNAINSLIKTLVSKGIIGQNEVAELMEGNDRLSPQGKEMVKNILLGSIFKPETIRMLGVDSAIKSKAVAAIRSVMDNLKLGDYSLRDEIDSAIQLLYEARRGDNKVDTLLRTPEFFGESAADRYPSISQMMALALEGKVSDFRDLINEYNREAAARNTGEGDMFGDAPTKEELIRDFLEYKKWKDYEISMI